MEVSKGVVRKYLTNLLSCFQHVKMSVLYVDSVEEVACHPVHEPGQYPTARNV